jgi:putative methyltransferase
MTIAQKFAETGVCANHMLAIQHTSPEVLAATDRANISTDKQVKVARALMSSGVPITVQLILGIPGDSLELWKRCLTDVMELGVHEDYEIYFYSLLPNAPAAEPEFMSQWQVETIDRYIFVGTAPSWKPSELGVRSNQSRLIVSTRSFSRQDWLQMWIYTVLVKALHNASVTRMIAMYLRLTHQVTYLAFYEGLVEEFFAKSPVTRAWYDEVVDCYRNFREQGDVRDRISVSDLPGFSQALEPSRWVDLQICRNFDRFFDALKAYLLAKYPEAPNLASVIEYQKQIVILPSYDRKRGKNFSTEHNWMRYFSEAAGRMGSESMGEPEFVPGSVVEVSDQTCGEKGHLVRPLDWGEGGESQRWIAWINSALQHRNSAPKRNFQRLQFRAPARAYAEAR